MESATKLLTKCFVRLDQPEVELDEDDFGNDSAFGQDMDVTDENAQPLAKDPTIEKAQGAQTHEAVKISYDDYVKIRELLVLHIRRDEERETNESWTGIKKKDLIDWYLNLIEDELESVDDMNKQTKVVDLVIKRLVDVENVLITMDKDEHGEPFLVDNPDFEI